MDRSQRRAAGSFFGIRSFRCALHQLVSVHQGYLEDLRTGSRSGFGRALCVSVSVPSGDFEAALCDMKTLGRMEAERQHASLASTVARAVIRITLIEDYRAPLQANLAEEFLQLQNSLVEGVGAIFFSVSLFLGVLFEFGLPLLFWAALLFVPGRLA